VRTRFQNLSEFFCLFEFCPFCRKRTVPIVSFPSAGKCNLNNKFLTLSFKNSGAFDFTIGLLDNKLYSVNDMILESSFIVIGMKCKKFHFFYSGTCHIIHEKLCIDAIALDKIHFIRILPYEGHFVANNYFQESTTKILITKNRSTHELTLPLVDFNFLSKKEIDKRLKTIQLLG
jgi:hypothetical protein